MSAGSLLEFRLPRPVDTTTIPGTVRVLQGRSTICLNATVSGDGRVVQVTTDGLPRMMAVSLLMIFVIPTDSASKVPF
jgi:hypothetical protein